MEITKAQVLEALELIEKYKSQALRKLVTEIFKKESDTRSILYLDLETKQLNSLRMADINTIGELLAIGRFDLRKFRNLGRKGIESINEAIKGRGIETPPFLTF